MKDYAFFCRLFFVIIPMVLLSCNTTPEHQTENAIAKITALDIHYIDSTVSPGDDFFRFANGIWLDKNPVPGDKTRWGEFNVLQEMNNDRIKSIIDELVNNKEAKAGSNEMKIKNFYATGMDTATIDKLGASPLKPIFEQIEAIKTKEDFQNVVASFQRMRISTLFSIYSESDQKNSEMVIANIRQAGLGLPNKDYYISDKERFKNVRKAYVEHVTKMFNLLGDDDAVAQKNAETIMKIENRLAEASFTMLEQRDPQRNYNKMSVDELSKLSPEFNWKNYFEKIAYPDIQSLNVEQVPFFKALSPTLKLIDVDDWKTFLRWKLINRTASYLSSDFENQDFDFYSKTLSGQKEMSPRWKRVLATTNGALSEAIGEIYVKKFFPPEAKKKMELLIKNLRVALAKRIKNLTWMSEPTKIAANEKLEAFGVKVGYPEEWRNYATLKVGTASYIENIINSSMFQFKYNMDKVGKPINKKEWGMPPQKVNAYYSPNRNEIVFPAAILQPPFFNLDADDAVNYGAIGVVIGHEMSHGFDDQGSQYDKNGNLRNWWAKEDTEKYKEQTQKLVNHFNGFVAIDSFKVNGQLTLGENIGDFGGLTIAYEALKIAEKGNLNKKIDGLTLAQRFFMSYAVIWRSNITDKALMRQVKEDVHSPAKFRVNGGLFNVPEFYEAFDIKKDDKLYRPVELRPVIW